MRRVLLITAMVAAGLWAGNSISRASQCPVSEFIGANSVDAFVPAGGAVAKTDTIIYHFKSSATNPRGRIISSYGYHVTSGIRSSHSFWTNFVTRYTTLSGIFTSSSRVTIIVPLSISNAGNPDDMLYQEIYDTMIVDCLVRTPAVGWVGLVVLVALLGLTGVLLVRRHAEGLPG